MNELSPPHIVCAACRHGDFIAVGPRHMDDTMRVQIEAYMTLNDLPKETWAEFDQGFVDQHGKFYERDEAAMIVHKNGQPFDLERNGGQKVFLFSEGLY